MYSLGSPSRPNGLEYTLQLSVGQYNTSSATIETIILATTRAAMMVFVFDNIFIGMRGDILACGFNTYDLCSISKGYLNLVLVELILV